MSAADYNFEIEQGVSFKFAIVYKDCTQTPIDITDWCCRITMRTTKNTVLVFTTENTDYTQYKLSIDGPNGKITWLLPAETTNDWDFKYANYDLEIESPDDFYQNGGKYTKRLLEGRISVVRRNSMTSSLLECQP